MKKYKEFPKKYIGASDIGALVLVGCGVNDGVQPTMLNFGEDGDYIAYVVDEKNVEIGQHYKLRNEFECWLKIYDDDGKTFDVVADHIKIYRAGEFGCIIQYYNE